MGLPFFVYFYLYHPFEFFFISSHTQQSSCVKGCNASPSWYSFLCIIFACYSFNSLFFHILTKYYSKQIYICQVYNFFHSYSCRVENIAEVRIWKGGEECVNVRICESKEKECVRICKDEKIFVGETRG